MDQAGFADLLLLGSGLLLSGLCASIETALVGIPEVKIHAAIDKKVRGAAGLRYWLDAAGRILTTLHTVQIASAVVVVFAFLRLGGLLSHGEVDAWIALVLSAVALLVTHLVSRVLAKRASFEWARLMIPVARALTVCLTPVVYPFHLLVAGIGWGGSTSTPGASAYWTSDELGKMVSRARGEVLGKPGEDLLHSIISFSDTLIREIMVPRTEMVAIPVNTEPNEIRRVVVEVGHSRIPVYSDTIDNISGLLHVKDLFAGEVEADLLGVEHRLELEALLRPSFYVPEVMKISELLREFQRRKTHMAIVVDEYGGTAGVVTLEDIIEEIVGEIQDEYDVEEKQFRMVGDQKIIADGRVDLDELGEVLGQQFPDDQGYETLAGFLTAQAGYLPESGTVISWNSLVFTVKEADEKRIAMVEVDRSGISS